MRLDQMWSVILSFLLAIMSLGPAFAQQPVQPESARKVTLTFEVSVPQDTPDDGVVCISGSHPVLGNWDGRGMTLTRVGESRYSGEVTLPVGSRVEFKVTRGSWQTVEKDEHGGEVPNRVAIADQDKRIELTVASWANGQLPQGEPTLTGDIRRHEHFASKLLKNERTVLVYLPPGYDEHPDRRYPVLYMHDGQNIFDASTSFLGVEWGVDESAERLIASKTIEPIIIVGIYNNADRVEEYTPGETGGKGDLYARFLVEEVKPFLDRTYRTDPSRDKTGVAGSSLGGLISLYIVWRHPETFGRCGAVSPSLWWSDGWLLKQWEQADLSWAKAVRFWIDMGTAEGNAVDPESGVPKPVLGTRRLVRILERVGLVRGQHFAYLEAEGASHNEAAWAARIDDILAYLYGLPGDGAETE